MVLGTALERENNRKTEDPRFAPRPGVSQVIRVDAVSNFESTCFKFHSHTIVCKYRGKMKIAKIGACQKLMRSRFFANLFSLRDDQNRGEIKKSKKGFSILSGKQILFLQSYFCFLATALTLVQFVAVF